MTVETFPTPEVLSSEAASQIEQRLADIQAEGRMPLVALTGGTIAGATYALLGHGRVDWTRVRFHWGDERFLPAGDADRNDTQARTAFLDRLEVPAENIVPMPAADGALNAADAAGLYSDRLPQREFDLVLLGVGPDGHVASLFPGHDQVLEQNRMVVEELDSPKPPPARISLTLPRLNNAHSAWLLVSGAGKAEAVARALDDTTTSATTISASPASGVRAKVETRWLIDQDAASATRKHSTSFAPATGQKTTSPFLRRSRSNLSASVRISAASVSVRRSLT